MVKLIFFVVVNFGGNVGLVGLIILILRLFFLKKFFCWVIMMVVWLGFIY